MAKEDQKHEVIEARRGLMQVMKEHFSSTPIPASQGQTRSSLVLSGHSLTSGERKYLEGLLESDDPENLRRASERLSDTTLFPCNTEEENDEIEEPRAHSRRDSEVQRQLFRLHNQTGHRPSSLLKRMSFSEHKAILEPSIVEDNDVDNSIVSENESVEASSSWDPFVDVNSWIDGNEGVEVDDDGKPLSPKQQDGQQQHVPFEILGTAADDVSCHPHVLSPPLMEGLLEFVPESLSHNHFWLKYSLVRDGPRLSTLLKQVRASFYTILAIETTDGHVLGAFCVSPWRRLSPGSHYGASTNAFVWRMRKSRLTECDTIVEQALLENELDVYPYTGQNDSVQFCSRNGLALGKGELQNDQIDDTHSHYGHAIALEPSLQRGSTSTSETFANPCLTHAEQQGAEFEVANIEVWTLTPHSTVDNAEHEEMHRLFTDEHAHKELNLLNILVGPSKD